MSEIRVTSLKDTAGNNSSTTEQVAHTRAKAFVNFNGQGAVAIRTNFNVNSILDNGVGDYTVNLSTALLDSFYVPLSFVFKDNELNDNAIFTRTTPNSTRTSSAFRFYTTVALGSCSDFDSNHVTIAFFHRNS